MSVILREYIDEEGLQVTEYTRDGETVSSIIRQYVTTEVIEPKPIESQLTSEEVIKATLLETQYQTLLIEMLAGF